MTSGGTDGNRLLTAQTGAVLIVLLAVIGITILRMGQLVSVHMFVGMMLIPIVLLKMSSTGYRFARYYTFDPSYRRAGPPAPLLRIIAPMVLLSTIAVFVTGVILMIEGPSGRGTLSELHKLSFIVWIAFTALHVIGHLGEIPGAISRRYRGVLSGLSTCTISSPTCALQPFAVNRINTRFAAGAGIQYRFGALGLRAEYERFDAAGGNPSLLSLGLAWTFL